MNKYTIYKKARSGVTLIEVLIVFGLFMILLGIGTINTGKATQSASLESTRDELVAEVAGQQQQAMTGYDGSATAARAYGVRFEPDRYIEFPGSTYVANDPGNRIVVLAPTLSFSSIDLPNQALVFASQSGELVGYDAAHNSVRLTDSVTGKYIDMKWNILGVMIP